MSGAAINYTPNGRRGVGVNQPQSGLDYPLVNPSIDIRYLLADFYFAYNDNAQTVKHPLHIKWLYGLGDTPTARPNWAPANPPHAADIIIADDDDNVVFDSTTLQAAEGYERFNSWCWGLNKTTTCPATYDYKIYEWVGLNAICRLVAYQTWPPSAEDSDEDAARSYGRHIVPETAVIDERAIYKMPKHVTAFILPAYSVKVTRTAVDFAAGFNSILEASDAQTRGLRATRQVSFAAVPGAGLGKYVDCVESSPVIRNLNGNSGPDLLLAGTQCLRLQLPTTYSANTNLLTPQRYFGSATYQIASNCPACCTCDDYVDLGRYMNSTRDKYKKIGGDTSGVALIHADNIERWLAQRNCRLQKPLKICMTPQRCPYIDVVAQYCNMCEDCAKNVVININFSSSAATAADVVCGYTTIDTAKLPDILYTLAGEWPNFSANLGDVDAGNSASVQFRLEFAPAVPTTITATATGTADTVPVLAGCDATAEIASARISKPLYCNNTGGTVAPCGVDIIPPTPTPTPTPTVTPTPTPALV